MYASRLSTTKADRYGFEFAFSDQLPHFRVAKFPSSARARGTGMSRGLSLSLERCSFRGLTGLISGLSVRA
jgi:hypothetical protein